MKRHLNTLYITSDDAYISKEHETFVVTMNDTKVFQAPVRTIENIVCFGFKSISPALMAFCTENGVGISYLTPTGRFLARIQGAQHGNVLLRKAQYQIADTPARALMIAQPIIAAKLSNSRSLLMRHLRNHPDLSTAALQNAIATITSRISACRTAESLDVLRGYEGECAAAYFGCFASLFTSQSKDFYFEGRSRRPPLDPVNAVLSFVYAMLTNDVRSALEVTGLDPQVGFLHTLRSGRPSLALDVMEEFRAYIADRVVLNLINLRQISVKDFEKRESGEVVITDGARKTILTAYQNRKQEEITHPFLNEKMTIGILPLTQCQLLARYVRGDMSEYPAFCMKG